MKYTTGLPFSLQPGQKVCFVPPQTDTIRSTRVVKADDVDEKTAQVVFAGIDDVATAKRLVGCHCLVRRADLPPIDYEHEPEAWRGWTVADERFGNVGAVAGLIEGAQQDLLEIERPDKTAALVPLVDEFIVAVDAAAKTVRTSLPDGLLDL